MAVQHPEHYQHVQLHGRSSCCRIAKSLNDSRCACRRVAGVDARRPSTPPSTGGGSAMAMDLSPGPLLPRLGAMGASQTALLHPAAQVPAGTGLMG